MLQLYYEGDTLQLAKGEDDDVPTFDPAVFDDAAQMVYDAGGFDASQLTDPRARKVIDATTQIINRAVETSIPHDVPETLRYALENNGFIFSGFKTFHALREVGLSMLDDKGNVKPFDDFRKDVQQINQNYNVNWLNAEYKHALGSSLMAVKWADLSKDTDRYFLQYRTAQDSRVRPDHAALDGITLPADDPFWSKYYPPNGWGCRCQAVQVRRSKYQPSDPKEAMKLGDEATDTLKQRMFRYNAGTEMQLFPPKHPYYKAPAAAKKVIKQLTAEQKKNKRVAELRAQLPDNLTDAEKDAKALNNYEIAEKLGVKVGKPMSVEQADKQSANPKHVLKFIPDANGNYWDKATGERFRLNPNYKETRDRPFSINCQTCAPAYALRLMGFDVKAKGNTTGSLSEYLSRQHSFEAWKNSDGTECTPILTNSWMVSKKYKTMTEKRYREYFNECCKEEGVYILTIGWRGGGGHATILQRMKDGTLAYIEPQEYNDKKGAARSIDELCKSGATKPLATRGILRVDNKIFNTKFISIFDK